MVHDVYSPYSRIQVVDYGELRALRFVGESPVDVVETLIDRREPYRLQHRYAQAMMAGLIYRAEPSSVLLIGLGGGALVHFLQHHFPELQLDVVEIDPEIVRVAREYFGAAAGPRTRIFVADGYEHLARSSERYDLILMNAHLMPSTLTDSTGHPLTVKTSAFFRSLHDRLRPGGIVMFNMIAGDDAERYIASIHAAFSRVDVLRPPGTLNIVIAAGEAFPGDEALGERASALDRRGRLGFSFADLVYWRAGMVRK